MAGVGFPKAFAVLWDVEAGTGRRSEVPPVRVLSRWAGRTYSPPSARGRGGKVEPAAQPRPADQRFSTKTPNAAIQVYFAVLSFAQYSFPMVRNIDEFHLTVIKITFQMCYIQTFFLVTNWLEQWFRRMDFGRTLGLSDPNHEPPCWCLCRCVHPRYLPAEDSWPCAVTPHARAMAKPLGNALSGLWAEFIKGTGSQPFWWDAHRGVQELCFSRCRKAV